MMEGMETTIIALFFVFGTNARCNQILTDASFVSFLFLFLFTITTGSSWPAVAGIAPNRPQQVLIYMARRGWLREEVILDALTETCRACSYVNSDKNHGVNVEAIQRILSTGQSCIADVDVGLAADQRGAFLAAIQMAKRGLVPSPCTVLAMGDLRNRHGILGDEYLGVNELDLRKTKDGALKRTLQVAAESVSPPQPQPVRPGEGLGEAQRERAHALVLEAIVILLTPSNPSGPSLAVPRWPGPPAACSWRPSSSAAAR